MGKLIVIKGDVTTQGQHDSNIVELTFKVGIRVCALYLLYKLTFEGLLEKLVDKL